MLKSLQPPQQGHLTNCADGKAPSSASSIGDSHALKGHKVATVGITGLVHRPIGADTNLSHWLIPRGSHSQIRGDPRITETATTEIPFQSSDGTSLQQQSDSHKRHHKDNTASISSLPESSLRPAPQGELLSPCRCDGSVRCTHQPCLIRWISERGSWSCELCYFKYQVLAISTKNPLQWQAISLTVIEKVQIAAIVLGSLFLVASISWLIWSSLSPSAKWQRQDLLFQICYGMYGFMDVVCIGLIVHEGSSVYRIFKRWQAVNQQWKVLNYDKTKDIGGDAGGGSAGKPGPRTSRTGPPSGATSRPPAAQRMRTLLPQRCGYTILHLLGQLRPPDARSSSQSGREVVMRVTTV
uniref:RING-type E3 ubiquitin transferase n=1 Tax=Equus caballus TaxID=9796 RepID=A0A9L0RDG6_HORSE